MAIYMNNRLIKSGDFIRITREYSSPQSLNQARKNGSRKPLAIGKMHFFGVMSEEAAALHGISSWEGLPIIDSQNIPAGLSPLSKISKKIKMGETVIISWALLNRIDVYWIAGHFFAHEQKAVEIAAGERARIASFTKPPKVRRKRRYLHG